LHRPCRCAPTLKKFLRIDAANHRLTVALIELREVLASDRILVRAQELAALCCRCETCCARRSKQFVYAGQQARIKVNTAESLEALAADRAKPQTRNKKTPLLDNQQRSLLSVNQPPLRVHPPGTADERV
jgi:hypothetical protein